MKIAEFKTEGHYQEILPEKSLSNFIQSYYIFNLDKVPTHQRRELIQPALFPKVVFKFGGDYENHHVKSNKTEIIKSSTISGVQLDAIASKRCNTNEKALFIGVRFHPVGLYHILNMPMNEVLNQRIDIEDLSCNILKRIEWKLQTAKSNSEILSILNDNFTKYFLSCSLNDECEMIYHAMNLNSSKQLYGQQHNLSSSYKRLERKFKKYIGIPPSRYYKLKRFLQFYEHWQTSDEYKYIDGVYKFDYFDQNHLVKDFKSILGQSPNKFKKSKNEYFTENILAASLKEL